MRWTIDTEIVGGILAYTDTFIILKYILGIGRTLVLGNQLGTTYTYYYYFLYRKNGLVLEVERAIFSEPIQAQAENISSRAGSS